MSKLANVGLEPDFVKCEGCGELILEQNAPLCEACDEQDGLREEGKRLLAENQKLREALEKARLLVLAVRRLGYSEIRGISIEKMLRTFEAALLSENTAKRRTE